jgi:predicted enzyme related to lactoylglutathione lyase
MREQPNINYIDVKSVDEYSSKVEKLGGKVVVPKSPVPEIGYFAVCFDTENICIC